MFTCELLQPGFFLVSCNVTDILYLLMDVSKTIQYFSEQSPQPILILVQAVVYCVS